MREMKRILVDVDGSEASKRALRWPLDEANVRGSEVIAMHAWSFPPVVDVPFDTGADVDWESGSQRCLDDAVDAVVQQETPPSRATGRRRGCPQLDPHQSRPSLNGLDVRARRCSRGASC